MRFIAQFWATAWTSLGPEGRKLRRGLRTRQRDDPSLQAVALAIFTGPDHLDPQVCTEAFRRHYLGPAC